MAVVALSLMACSTASQKPAGMTDEALEAYQSTLEAVQSVEHMLDEAGSSLTMSAEQAIELNELARTLRFDYDPLGMDSASEAACSKLKERVDALRPRLLAMVDEAVGTIEMVVLSAPDKLVESTFCTPVYLERGDSLIVRVRTERPSTLTIYNADARSTEKSLSGKTEYTYTQRVRNTAIYLVELNPGTKAQYADVEIRYIGGSLERVSHPRGVSSEVVEAQKGDWHATSVKGVEMRNLFSEPRKFTLRGQIKAAFSGSSRALVALQVPQGATDVLYSLRIATNETDRSQDGEFYDNMNISYKRIRFLGLPLYDRQGGSGLLSTLLGDNQPLREEDAYINMYVFYNADQAKKFQDGKAASELKYSVDYSTLGTQSCNGRIPAQGHKTVYLGFENERMRYNNYVWLEAVSAVPNTEYFKTKYTVAD